jgi:hypothetical protein
MFGSGGGTVCGGRMIEGVVAKWKHGRYHGEWPDKRLGGRSHIPSARRTVAGVVFGAQTGHAVEKRAAGGMP